MGSIRTLLAISVVFAHSYGFFLVGGQLAVQLFYTISGFLISYILLDLKSYDSIRNFYFNRVLRLYPIYLTVAGIVLIIWVVNWAIGKNPKSFDVYSEIGLIGNIVLVFSNVFIFGQDWVVFTGVKDGVFQFMSNFHESEIKIYQGLLVPPAWTLSVELYFYLIAPFVLRRVRLLLALLAASLALRVYLIHIGLGLNDPWTYRFFPTELALFLLGALSHQFLWPFVQRMSHPSAMRLSAIAVMAIGIYCSIFAFLPYRSIHSAILLALFLVTLPLLLKFQQYAKWDRKIGELSYPIYISHFPLVPIGAGIVKAIDLQGYEFARPITVVGLSVLVSLLLNATVTTRFQDRRNRVRNLGSAGTKRNRMTDSP